MRCLHKDKVAALAKRRPIAWLKEMEAVGAWSVSGAHLCIEEAAFAEISARFDKYVPSALTEGHREALARGDRISGCCDRADQA